MKYILLKIENTFVAVSATIFYILLKILNPTFYHKQLCFSHINMTKHIFNVFFVFIHPTCLYPGCVSVLMLYSLLYFDLHPHFPPCHENHTSCSHFPLKAGAEFYSVTGLYMSQSHV